MELEGNIAELERSQRSMEATHKDNSNQAEQREASLKNENRILETRLKSAEVRCKELQARIETLEAQFSEHKSEKENQYNELKKEKEELNTDFEKMIEDNKTLAQRMIHLESFSDRLSGMLYYVMYSRIGSPVCYIMLYIWYVISCYVFIILALQCYILFCDKFPLPKLQISTHIFISYF